MTRRFQELGEVVSILTALSVAAEGAMARLRSQLPAVLEPSGPAFEVFTIGDRDAGIATQISCTRSDGRAVVWLVEVWIYDDDHGWSANVKAEIDLSDDDDERCVLNDQQIVTTASAVAESVARAAQLLVSHPRGDLLTAGWEPPEWAE